MLYLLFQIGDDRYALDSSQIDMVLPLVRCKKIPGAPAWVEGLFSHDDTPVPVIDISMLATGTPGVHRLSTRVVLVRFQPKGQMERLLGLQVEHATTTLHCDAADFIDSGVDHNAARYLGPVKRHENRLIQRIEVADLLDASVHALLFPEVATQ